MNQTHRDAIRATVTSEMARRGLSKAALAKSADVDPKTLRAFLSGERWPQIDKRAAISTALGWQPDEIDHMDATGEHRGVVSYRHQGSDEVFTKPHIVQIETLDIRRMWIDALDLAGNVYARYPDLHDEVQIFIDAASHLFDAAIAQYEIHGVSKGGDGDDEGDAASNSEADEMSALDDQLQAAAKKGVVEESGEFNT